MRSCGCVDGGKFLPHVLSGMVDDISSRPEECVDASSAEIPVDGSEQGNVRR